MPASGQPASPGVMTQHGPSTSGSPVGSPVGSPPLSPSLSLSLSPSLSPSCGAPLSSVPPVVPCAVAEPGMHVGMQLIIATLTQASSHADMQHTGSIAHVHARTSGSSQPGMVCGSQQPKPSDGPLSAVPCVVSSSGPTSSLDADVSSADVVPVPEASAAASDGSPLHAPASTRANTVAARVVIAGLECTSLRSSRTAGHVLELRSAGAGLGGEPVAAVVVAPMALAPRRNAARRAVDAVVRAEVEGLVALRLAAVRRPAA